MSYIDTKEDWWNLLSENKDKILDLIAKYHPLYQRQHIMPITAERAEQVSQKIRKEIVENSKDVYGNYEDPQRRFEALLKDKNSDINTIINETYWGMPESWNVRSEPGFGVLCDLCSEKYVLFEEE